MNTTLQDKMSELFLACTESRIDLMTFCNEFCFCYFHLEHSLFKTICKPLFESASKYLLSPIPSSITPKSILQASELLNLIEFTQTKLNEARPL